MAGSYRHITTKKGKLRAPGRNLLDNLGDANEAIEELFGMLWYLADRLNSELPGATGNDAKDRAALVEEARQNYKFGLDLSPGVQKAGPGKAEPLGHLPFGYSGGVIGTALNPAAAGDSVKVQLSPGYMIPPPPPGSVAAKLLGYDSQSHLTQDEKDAGLDGK